MAYPFDDDDKAILGAQNPSMLEQYKILTQQREALQTDKDIAVLFGLMDVVPTVGFAADAVRAKEAAASSERALESARAAEQQAIAATQRPLAALETARAAEQQAMTGVETTSAGLEAARRRKEQAEEGLFVESVFPDVVQEGPRNPFYLEQSLEPRLTQMEAGIPAPAYSRQVGGYIDAIDRGEGFGAPRFASSGKPVREANPYMQFNRKAQDLLRTSGQRINDQKAFDIAEIEYRKTLEEMGLEGEDLEEYLAAPRNAKSFKAIGSDETGMSKGFQKVKELGLDENKLKDADGNWLNIREARSLYNIDEAAETAKKDFENLQNEIIQQKMYVNSLPISKTERQYMLEQLVSSERSLQKQLREIKAGTRRELGRGATTSARRIEDIEERLTLPDRIKITKSTPTNIVDEQVQYELNSFLTFAMDPEALARINPFPGEELPTEYIGNVVGFRINKLQEDIDLAENLLKGQPSASDRIMAQDEIRDATNEIELLRTKFPVGKTFDEVVQKTRSEILSAKPKPSTLYLPPDIQSFLRVNAKLMMEDWNQASSLIAASQARKKLTEFETAGQAVETATGAAEEALRRRAQATTAVETAAIPAEEALKRRRQASAAVMPTATEAADMAKAYTEARVKAAIPFIPLVGAGYEYLTADEQQADIEKQMEEMYQSASDEERAEIDRFLRERKRREQEAFYEVPEYEPIP